MPKYIKILYKRQFTGYNTTEPRSVLFSISKHQQTSANAKNAILDIDWILDDIGWYWMILDDIGWYWMILDDIGWYWMILDDIGWYVLCYWRNLVHQLPFHAPRIWDPVCNGESQLENRSSWIPILKASCSAERSAVSSLGIFCTPTIMERSYWGQWFLNCFKLGLPHYINLHANCEVFTQVHMYYVRNVN